MCCPDGSGKTIAVPNCLPLPEDSTISTRMIPSSPRTVRWAHAPEVRFTVAVQLSTLGMVQVENFHLVPGAKPSGNARAFVTYTGRRRSYPDLYRRLSLTALSYNRGNQQQKGDT